MALGSQCDTSSRRVFGRDTDMASRRTRGRRTLAAGIAAVAATGLVAASAATLGGITTQDLGADSTAVASCDNNGVSVDYTPAYSASIPNYALGDVTVSGIAAGCVGETLKVTLSTTANASLQQQSIAVTGASETLTFSNVDAEAVTGVAVVISG